MYLGQHPYKVIIRKKKNKEQNQSPTDSKSMPESHSKRDQNIIFQNELRSINKMI